MNYERVYWMCKGHGDDTGNCSVDGGAVEEGGGGGGSGGVGCGAAHITLIECYK